MISLTLVVLVAAAPPPPDGPTYDDIVPRPVVTTAQQGRVALGETGPAADPEPPRSAERP